MQQSAITKKSYLGGLFGSTRSQSSDNRFSTGTEALAALNLTVASAGDTTLVGTNINIGGKLKFDVAGNLNIQAAINSQRKEFFEHKLGLVTMTTETERSFQETANLTRFVVGGTQEFNVGGQVDLTDYGTGDLRDLYPEELLRHQGLNLLKQDLADEYFYDKQVALSPAFKALVSIVVGSVIVPGLGLSGLTGFAADTWQLAAAEAFASQIIMGALDGAVSVTSKQAIY